MNKNILFLFIMLFINISYSYIILVATVTFIPIIYGISSLYSKIYWDLIEDNLSSVFGNNVCENTILKENNGDIRNYCNNNKYVHICTYLFQVESQNKFIQNINFFSPDSKILENNICFDKIYEFYYQRCSES